MPIHSCEDARGETSPYQPTPTLSDYQCKLLRARIKPSEGTQGWVGIEVINKMRISLLFYFILYLIYRKVLKVTKLQFKTGLSQ